MTSATELHKQPLIDFCNRVGSDPLLVQGAGGNVSWKDEDTLFVKASGTWLSEAATKDIFVPIDLAYVRAAINKDQFDVIPKVLGGTKLRPSIETMLHALLPHPVVVHLHSVEVIAYVVREKWIDDLNADLDGSINWAPVPYNKPGPDLARAVTEVIRSSGVPDVMFLQNHGIVLGGQTTEEVSQLLDQVLDALRTEPIAGHGHSVDDIQLHTCADEPMQLIADIDVQRLAQQSELTELMKNAWAISPDHVVFLGAEAQIANSPQEAKLFSGDLVFIEGLGVFSSPDFTQAKNEQLRCYFEVLVRQRPGAELKELAPEQVGELLDWDAEKYRQRLSK